MRQLGYGGSWMERALTDSHERGARGALVSHEAVTAKTVLIRPRGGRPAVPVLRTPEMNCKYE